VAKATDRSNALVIGAGSAGLGAAAMIRRAGVEVKVLERGAAPGASWRRRYDAMRLNSLATMSGPPGLRVDRRFGPYPTRDQWVSHLERYADWHHLHVETGVEVHRVERDGECWRLQSSSGDHRASYVVVAAGLDVVPDMPKWSGGAGFTGRLIHAADFHNAAYFVGQNILVVGCGNSGSEIAYLLAEGGADRVQLAVRTAPNIFPRFLLGLPLYPAAVVLEKLPTPVADSVGRLTQRVVYGDLSAYGLPFAPLGAKSTVHQRGIGPTIEHGFVEAVKSGQIQIVAAVDRFDDGDVVLSDGSRIQPDAVIAATGYRIDLEPLVGHLVELDPFGRPIVGHDQSAPGAPGLFFSGYWSGVCGPMRRMRLEARRIGRAVAHERQSRRPYRWLRQSLRTAPT